MKQFILSKKYYLQQLFGIKHHLFHRFIGMDLHRKHPLKVIVKYEGMFYELLIGSENQIKRHFAQFKKKRGVPLPQQSSCGKKAEGIMTDRNILITSSNKIALTVINVSLVILLETLFDHESIHIRKWLMIRSTGDVFENGVYISRDNNVNPKTMGYI